MMAIASTSTPRVQRLRRRRQEGVVMSCLINVGETEIQLLRSNGLLDAGEEKDREAVAEALVAAISQWGAGYGARIKMH